MSVDISNLTIAVPVAESSISTVAVELTGSEAIALYPNYVKVLSDGSVQLSAPTKGASSKSTRRMRIPRSSGHPFHEHLATDSTVIRPPIPRASGH